ncbi:MAG: hypothetical protein ACRD52_18765, partial [Candidatus Acidiferrales bacterium]
MTQAKAPRKAFFVLIWGVLMWGGSTALLMTLFNWYTPRQFGSGYEIVGRFVIFMGLGIYWGLYMWQKLSTLHSGKRTRT